MRRSESPLPRGVARSDGVCDSAMRGCEKCALGGENRWSDTAARRRRWRRRGIRRLIRGRTVRAAIATMAAPPVPSRAGTRHGIELLLLFRSEQGANLRFRLLPQRHHLGEPVFLRQRRVVPQRLALRSVFLKDGFDLGRLFCSEAQRRLHALELLARVARAPSRTALVVPLAGRRRLRRGRRLAFIRRADNGQGGEREAGGR